MRDIEGNVIKKRVKAKPVSDLKKIWTSSLINYNGKRKVKLKFSVGILTNLACTFRISLYNYLTYDPETVAIIHTLKIRRYYLVG